MTDQPDHPNDRTPPPAVHRFAHDAMGCTFELIIPNQEAAYAEQAAHAAFDEVDRIELELSRYVEHSDVARINALVPGQSIRIGMETLECLQLASAIQADTNGAFDVTASGADHASEADEEQLRSAGRDHHPRERRDGMQLIDLNPAIRKVTVKADGVMVDFGGIGKGYALDQVAALVREWKIPSALLHAGQSSVLALGVGPEGEPWSVGLRDPHDVRIPIGLVRLQDRSLSGSGQLLHGLHIVDPRSGRPCRATVGAWATAPSAAVSDALSTAFMVMSRAEVEAYCRGHEDVLAVLALPVGDGYELVAVGSGPPAFELDRDS
jgi:thiamine biosynthesis lipoprotein